MRKPLVPPSSFADPPGDGRRPADHEPERPPLLLSGDVRGEDRTYERRWLERGGGRSPGRVDDLRRPPRRAAREARETGSRASFSTGASTSTDVPLVRSRPRSTRRRTSRSATALPLVAAEDVLCSRAGRARRWSSGSSRRRWSSCRSRRARSSARCRSSTATKLLVTRPLVAAEAIEEPGLGSGSAGTLAERLIDAGDALSSLSSDSIV